MVLAGNNDYIFLDVLDPMIEQSLIGVGGIKIPQSTTSFPRHPLIIGGNGVTPTLDEIKMRIGQLTSVLPLLGHNTEQCLVFPWSGL